MGDEKDLRLVQRSLLGDERAFRRLVETYTPLVYSAVRAILGGYSDAEDVVQDIFIKVYKGLHSFRGKSKFSTWVYRIARNEALNVGVRKKPDLVTMDAMRDIESRAEAPDTHYETKADSAILNGLIERLEEKYRLVIELRYRGEKSYAEISEIMEIPEGTVKTYIHRAKAALKKMLTARNSGGSGDSRWIQ